MCKSHPKNLGGGGGVAILYINFWRFIIENYCTVTFAHSISVEEKAQWKAASAALDEKLADLAATVSELSSQNAALTALVGNCCRNNTLLADTVRAHVLSILTEVYYS